MIKNFTLFLFSFLLLVCSFYAGAQNSQVDGMNFENWNQNYYNVMFPTYYYWENMPNSIWASSNAATTIVNDFCCERSTDCHGGSYAARLETKSIFSVPAAGNLFTGTFIADMFNSKALRGVPFTDKPESFTGYFKYTPVNYNNGVSDVPDTCAIYAILSYWDGAQRVEIARAEMYTSDNISAYTLFDLDFTYYSTITPDTISIVFASSKYGDLFQGGIGSTLLIDDVALVYPVGYAENNPFESAWSDGDFWNFSFRTIAERHISVYDISGKTLFAGSTSELKYSISSRNFTNGVYLYQITEGNRLFSGKIVK
ncbi:hypothetical protein SDC9_55726 [bioreactor metagenome]|uniref:Putative carbohydrate metabolism domain-containing protein n=1 Tax=bioreactor metagenome TaxID=1076179 RepID=A0A644WZY8_9ZZZZ